MSKLIDQYGREHTYLRVSVTDRCNLRCFYCMPPEGIDWKPKKEILTFDEIDSLSRVMVQLGVEKIRLTGGEPLARKDLVVLAGMLSSIEGLKTLAMTTNALKLADNAAALRRAGIDCLNISIDSLRPERFERITGRNLLPRVMDGIHAALEAGFRLLKLNVVVMAGVNDDEVLDFVQFAHDKPLNVRFIEFMPFKNNDWNIDKVVTYKEMIERISQRYTLVRSEEEPGAVAKDYAIADAPGSVSFITSMSDSFCSSCNRLRLTSDGSLKTCLFFPAERSLRDLLRAGASPDEISQAILETLSEKPEQHPPAEEILAAENRSMIEIGG